MTVVASQHILVDDHGQALIAGTRTKVSLVARDMLSGLSAQQIHALYPHLSLAQIHAALAHYYDHQKEFDALLAKEDQAVEQIQSQLTRSSRAELAARQRNLGKTSGAGDAAGDESGDRRSARGSSDGDRG